MMSLSFFFNFLFIPKFTALVANTMVLVSNMLIVLCWAAADNSVADFVVVVVVVSSSCS